MLCLIVGVVTLIVLVSNGVYDCSSPENKDCFVVALDVKLAKEDVAFFCSAENALIMNNFSLRICVWLLVGSAHDAEDTKQSTADMTAFVQNLLQQMQSRIEELEQNINELRAEIGLESSPSPSVTEREKSPLRELKPETENP
ncbi:uncharacterized protein HKW66_Vig0090700 [Vigna angularis]|uniref:Secreted protein n=1 Tax=Phaseolus angularis TaxID=3914 RepID=A0A8T0KH05_PHAAN|nr:uncharacterized protein HKW66_Vig0090700 [Vigna angularis]